MILFYICYLLHNPAVLQIKFDYAIVEYKEPIVYFRITKGITMGEKEVMDVIRAGQKLCDNKPHLLLTDARVTVDVSPEGRAIGSKKENTVNLVAQAIVVKWLAQRLIANVFMEINKPHYPMRVFNDEGSALKWLMKQWKEKSEL